MRMINHFNNVHFPEVQPYKTYSSTEFRKKSIRILKTPDLTHVNIEVSAQQKQDESVLVYMGRVQNNVAKAFPKFPDAARQNMAVSMFCQVSATSLLRE